MGTHGRRYIWQVEDWPEWRYDLGELADGLVSVSRAQGLLHGRLADVGMELREQASLSVLSYDVLETSAIEGEVLNTASVRSSLAQRLGVDIGALAPVDRHVEGVVDMVLNATARAQEPLTLERLCGWHASLFPTGYSGSTKILVGQLRDDRDGPMQVVSGPLGNQRVHYEAPPADQLPAEVNRFLEWVNAETSEPALIKAGLAHLWLVTLHPFEDGNGRIARAVGDLLLARADRSSQRFYSLSAEVQRERKAYYEVLERTQRGDLDVTEWLSWFLEILGEAVATADVAVGAVLTKAAFWHRWGQLGFNERQVKVLNRVLDGFDGQLTTRKWAKLAKTSQDTALRDINQLLVLGVLIKNPGGGRSASYSISQVD